LGLVPFWTPALVEAGGSLPSERLDSFLVQLVLTRWLREKCKRRFYFGGMASSEKGSRLNKS
jgi:hypothetical protein